MSKNIQETSTWAADTSISRPEPSDMPVMVDFEGFGFTMNGMVHNLSEGEVEELFHPVFAPEGYRGGRDFNDLGDPLAGGD